MILLQKFDLTTCLDMQSMGSIREDIIKINDKIQDDRNNIELYLEKARLCAYNYESPYTVINYCRIIKLFNSEIAYEELAEYLYQMVFIDWAIITCQDGLKEFPENKKLKEVLDYSINFV